MAADLRAQAEDHFRDGWCSIAAAFDLCDSHEWRFDRDVQQRARALLEELHALFHRSEIRESRRVIATTTAANAATADGTFQHFLREMLRTPRRRSRHA